MTKLTLADLASLENQNSAIAAVNSNNATLEAAFENTLSRDGTSPNSMAATLDMNSNRIINLPTPIGANDPVRLRDLSSGSSASAIATHLVESQTLTYASTINWDFSEGMVAKVTLTGNPTINFPTNIQAGLCSITIVQDGTGGHTVTWDSHYKFGDITPGINTAADGETTFTFQSDGTNLHYTGTAVTTLFCDTDGSSQNTVVVTPVGGAVIHRLFDGLRLNFRSPISGPYTISVSNLGGSLFIYTPNSTQLVWVYTFCLASDIKEGSLVSVVYCSDDAYNTGTAHWSLQSTPLSWGEASSTGGGWTYFIVADAGGDQAICTGKFKVYDPDIGSWKYVHGGVIESLFNNTCYVNGQPNQSLTVGKVYFAYAFIPPGSGHLGITGVRMNFSSRFHDSKALTSTFAGSITGTTLNVQPTASFTGTISGTTLSVSSVSGTVAIGQTVWGAGVNVGTRITAGSGTSWTITPGSTVGPVAMSTITSGQIEVGQQITGNGALNGTTVTALGTGAGGPGTYTVSRSQTVSSAILSGVTGHYALSPEGPFAFDEAGNMGALLGICCAPENQSIWSYFSRGDAISAGHTPGNLTSNQPWSLYMPQPLTIYTEDTTIPVFGTGTFTGSAGEFNTSLRTYCATWEWRPDNRVTLNGWVSSTISGEEIHLAVTATPLGGATAGQPQISKTFICQAGAANQKIPVDYTVQWPNGDNVYLFSVSGSITGTATCNYALGVDVRTVI